jgi:hypothetical protein
MCITYIIRDTTSYLPYLLIITWNLLLHLPNQLITLLPSLFNKLITWLNALNQ